MEDCKHCDRMMRDNYALCCEIARLEHELAIAVKAGHNSARHGVRTRRFFFRWTDPKTEANMRNPITRFCEWWLRRSKTGEPVSFVYDGSWVGLGRRIRTGDTLYFNGEYMPEGVDLSHVTLENLIIKPWKPIAKKDTTPPQPSSCQPGTSPYSECVWEPAPRPEDLCPSAPMPEDTRTCPYSVYPAPHTMPCSH